MLATKIRKIIEDWVSSEKKFTAFDVTLEYRKTEFVEYYKVRKKIHEIMDEFIQKGFYERQMRREDNWEAWEYIPIAQLIIPTPTPILSKNLTMSTKIFKHTDSRNSLVIPKEFIQKIGLIPKTRAGVILSPRGRALVIFPYSKKADTIYTVDYHGNIRVTQSQLRRIAGSSTNNFLIKLDGSRILIEKK